MKAFFLSSNLFLLSMAFSNLSHADDFFMAEAPPAESEAVAECDTSLEDCPGVWTASVEFGYVAVSGNQDTNSLNGRFSLSYEVEKWRHAGYLATQSSSTKDNITGVETDARKLNAEYKTDYKYSEKAYVFGIADYDDTKDSGFDYQSSAALGLGYSFLKTKTHALDAEFGVGVRESKTEVTQESNSESIYRLAGAYRWAISKNSNFEQKLSTEVGDDNEISKSYTALSANILENLALKVSHAIKYQSDVPVGNENLETVTSFTVVYSF